MPENCTDVFSKINKYWAIHENVHCFYYNKSLIKKIMESEECFVGCDTSEIISLFGIPNGRAKNVLIYNLSSNCKEGDDFYSDYSLKFYIDFNNNPNLISSVKFGKVHVLY